MSLDTHEDDNDNPSEALKKAKILLFQYLVKTNAKIAYLLWLNSSNAIFEVNRLRLYGFIYPANQNLTVEDLGTDDQMMIGISARISVESNRIKLEETPCGSLHVEEYQFFNIKQQTLYDALEIIDPEAALTLATSAMRPAIESWKNVLEGAGRYDLLDLLPKIVEEFVDDAVPQR